MQRALKSIVHWVRRVVFNQTFDSKTHWEKHYAKGENSGAGSYGQLAQFKAEVINSFVEKHQINSVIEYGCGDGNQLQFFNFPAYLGFDISPTIVQHCRKRYADDATKTFMPIDEYTGETAQLTLSLDVIYHVVEDHRYIAYMQRLFASATAYVIIYSSNSDHNLPKQTPHIKHRCFTKWVEQNCPDWQLIQHIPNQHPDYSAADFYIYKKSVI